MVILFLDIDGVLTSARCNGFKDFDVHAVHFLRWACKESGAKIVISSTWRHFEPLQTFRNILGENIIHEDWKTVSLNKSMCRGEEIDEWLSRHPEIAEFIVIDDDVADMLPRHRAVQIHTSPMDGMLTSHMMQLRDMLSILTFPEHDLEVRIHDSMFGYKRDKEEIQAYNSKIKFID